VSGDINGENYEGDEEEFNWFKSDRYMSKYFLLCLMKLLLE
jgi:hypothetical protein